MAERDPANVAVATQNGGLLDLRRGDVVRDGEGERATFVSYGALEPVYVNLDYGLRNAVRLPNSELKLVRRAQRDDEL